MSGSVAELRARFLVLHDPAKVERAEARALFACALAVLEAATARRLEAEDGLAAALDAAEAARATEVEWCSVAHGLALRVAAAEAADESPAVDRIASTEDASDYEWL